MQEPLQVNQRLFSRMNLRETSMLKSSKEVVDLLKIAQRKYHETVILVTHDQEIASIADRVITIEDGKIIQDTNHI